MSSSNESPASQAQKIAKSSPISKQATQIQVKETEPFSQKMTFYFKIGLYIVIALIIAVVVYYVVKYWQYVKWAGLALGAALIAAAAAPFLGWILAGLAGIGTTALGFLKSFFDKSKDKMDEAKEKGDTEEADKIDAEAGNEGVEQANDIQSNYEAAKNAGGGEYDLPDGSTSNTNDSDSVQYDDGMEAGENYANSYFDATAQMTTEERKRRRLMLLNNKNRNYMVVNDYIKRFRNQDYDDLVSVNVKQ